VVWYVAVYCGVLRYVAVCCNTLQHTATHCNTPYRQDHGVQQSECQWAPMCGLHARVQHTATHYNTLQQTATHCNILQHTALHHTGWRRLIGSPKLQIIFHKRATKSRSLLRKMTYKDKGSYESSPPCTDKTMECSSLNASGHRCVDHTCVFQIATHCNKAQQTAIHCSTPYRQDHEVQQSECQWTPMCGSHARVRRALLLRQSTLQH